MSDLVVSPGDWFSHVAAQMLVTNIFGGSNFMGLKDRQPALKVLKPAQKFEEMVSE